MIEPNYPEAWGVLVGREIAFYADTKSEAEEYLSDRRKWDPECDSYCEIVRLIPEPTVEREARHNYAIWSRWVGVVKGVIDTLPNEQREPFVVACREYKGPCFCGCHTSEAQA